MPDGTDHEVTDSTSSDDTDVTNRTSPVPAAIPSPEAICDVEDPTGTVVWHRKHLRIEDHLALSRAVADSDAVCPLFVFDPTFYAERGLACDARIRFLEEAVASLDRLYAATPARAVHATETDARAQHPDDLAVNLPPSATDTDDTAPETLRCAEPRGLTAGYGDPVTLLSRFVDCGWSVATMATPTSRYGHRRDTRVRDACGDAVTFVSGDGLVREEEWPRSDWQTQVNEWLTAPQRDPRWGDQDTVRVTIPTGVTPAGVDRYFDIMPAKAQVPPGTHRAATTALREFTDRIRSYPSHISAPQDAREGTSGLSPYLNFGLLSVRQAYQYVADNAPSCRGREMFQSRLVWNLHYNQKLVDWPGWTERAVNPALEGRNEDRRDADLVTAWKHGETGFPMVDAAMRCLRETGWLNFRMRAMCASFFTHILHQPWWIGADWFHHHLIDSDVGINYTQWQSQAGLIGKPSQRVYNPRKQVRDQDPEGEWITTWVSELTDLPSEFLDRPEKTPLAVQQNCGVRIGETYPRPVVDFEARREQFWTRYERSRHEAAQELRRPEIAKRASFSGGYSAARAIADRHGGTDADAANGTQLSFDEVNVTGADGAGGDGPTAEQSAPTTPTEAGPSAADAETTVPSGTGREAGEPSPDDRKAASSHQPDDPSSDARDGADEPNARQTDFRDFE